MELTEPPRDILEWLKLIELSYDIPAIMIEDVHSLYGMSAKSNFRFGYNVGMINTLAECTDIPIEKVQPKVWQKHIGIQSKGKEIKKEVAEFCKKLYPKADIYTKRNSLLDGRSDSLMIAHYAMCNYKL